jgi:E3 ubiquitin-protein ligase HECTD4
VKVPEDFNESSASIVSLSDDIPCNQLVFVYPSVLGEEVELCLNGSTRPVTWDSRLEFVELVKGLRYSELASRERITAIRCGMASIIPIQLLHLLTPRHIQLRTCGHSEINLVYLKAHTMYQVGLMETDRHIQYFWRALESFSQVGPTCIVVTHE